ncbi:hypothetical protein ACFO3J_11605 [Streptomyces polygonati]|uniref:Uncharacterized protein n=1 Tax=Streptomyces polygonati TaxID=1617087 RepID=A0ABV8HLT2_9ACTN
MESVPAPLMESAPAAVVDRVSAPVVESVPAVRPARPVRAKRKPKPERVFVEPKGCLYALSQPPLMLFLCVIGGLIGGGAAWDLLFT